MTAIALCLALMLPGIVDEDGSCVPIERVTDRVLIELADRNPPPPWSWAVEDTMNLRTDDGLGG